MKSAAGSKNGMRRLWFCRELRPESVIVTAHLGPDQQIPALDEVSAQVSRRLADDLQPDVMPRHPRDLATVEDILERFVEVAVLCNTLVRVVFASPDGAVGAGVFGEVLVCEDMLRGVPSTVTPAVSYVLPSSG